MGRFSVAIFAMLVAQSACFGQQAAQGAALLYTFTYSRCLNPVSFSSLALDEQEQKSYGPDACRTWSSFEQLTVNVTEDDVQGKANQQAAVAAFTKAIAGAGLNAEPERSRTADLYVNFRDYGWALVPATRSKAGSLIVWNGMLAFVGTDESEPSKVELSKMTVRYPKLNHETNKYFLNTLQADTLDTDLRKRQKKYSAPVFIQPAYRLSAYWNAWISQASNRQLVDGGVLKKGDLYEFNLDISALDFGNPAIPNDRLATDSGLKTLESLDENARVFKVHAIPFGGLIPQVAASVAAPVYRKVDISRLKLTSLDRTATDPLTLSKKYGGFQPLPGDVNQSSLITVQLRAFDEGCGGVVFSIWNAVGDRAIGHVVKQVAVTASGLASMDGCPITPEIGIGVDAPRLFRLAVSEGAQFDATLLALELDTNNTAFVYSDLNAEKPYQWVSNTGLSNDLNDLRDDITLAHEQPQQYKPTEISRSLEQMIFGVGRSTAGTEALTALRNLAKASSVKSRKRVLARFVDKQNQLLFLPINLLTFDESKPTATIGEALEVQQPLPLDQGKSGACIERWYGAFNADDTPTAFPSNPPEFNLVKLPQLEQLGSYSALDDFLKRQPDKAVRGEALMLLAHHANNQIRFRQSEVQSVKPSSISRLFPKRSAALLAACSVATIGTRSNGRKLLEVLNQQGVSTIIASPFGVPDIVGGVFMLEFRKAVLELSEKNVSATMYELFHLALERTKSSPDIEDENTRLMAAEFHVMGIGSARLCRQ